MTSGKSGKIKGLIQLLLVLLFVGGALYLSSTFETERPSSSENGEKRILFAETDIINADSHRISFEATGTIEALAEIDVVPEVSGRVISVNEKFFTGGYFGKDEILFQIDPRDFELEVRRLKAEVARAKTALALEKAEAESAIAEWSQVNSQQTIPDLVARKPQLAEARANLNAARAQLENAKLDLERTAIILPFDGAVLSSSVSEGLYVAAGQSVASVFDVDNLEVRVAIEDEHAKWLMGSDNIDISIEAKFLGRTQNYDGFVKRGASFINSDTRFSTITVGIIGEDNLLPGLFATIYFQGDVLQNVFRVPASSLQKGGGIWAIDENDELYRIDADVLYTGNDYLIVSGLKNPVEIVVSRIDGGAEGIKIARVGQTDAMKSANAEVSETLKKDIEEQLKNQARPEVDDKESLPETLEPEAGDTVRQNSDLEKRLPSETLLNAPVFPSSQTGLKNPVQEEHPGDEEHIDE